MINLGFVIHRDVSGVHISRDVLSFCYPHDTVRRWPAIELSSSALSAILRTLSLPGHVLQVGLARVSLRGPGSHTASTWSTPSLISWIVAAVLWARCFLPMLPSATGPRRRFSVCQPATARPFTWFYRRAESFRSARSWSSMGACLSRETSTKWPESGSHPALAFTSILPST